MSPDVIVLLVLGAIIAFVLGRVMISQRKQVRGREERPALPEKVERAEKAEKAKARAEAEREREEEAAEAEAEEAEEEKPAAKPDRSALRLGLGKTRSGFVAKLSALFKANKEIDAATMDRIEEVLLSADIGIKTSTKIFESLKKELTREQLTDERALWDHIKKQSTEILAVGAAPLDLGRTKPFVILVIGVNGVGKTTTIGKLAAQYSRAGKKVLLAAGDTFRAAATEQLVIWGDRTGCEVVKGKEGGDPSSVIFDAVKRAQAEAYDVLIADTAGRLHTKSDLMDELQKVRRVVNKAQEGAPHETFLVLDATTGQNAIAQATMFQSALAASGIILTKLDGTAKGGVILGIADELKIPVRYIGIGEKVDDLREFDANDFVAALYDTGDESAAA
jgi:fused signal recognition particle receptor